MAELDRFVLVLIIVCSLMTYEIASVARAVRKVATEVRSLVHAHWRGGRDA